MCLAVNPLQIEPNTITHRSCKYSVCCVAWEIGEGYPLSVHPSPIEILSFTLCP